MRAVDLIVIHCSATPNGKPFTTADIDAWHHQRGFRRALDFRERQEMNLAAIGYHWVIYTNGAVANGRHLDEVGAHAKDHNLRSIGVCMIGSDRFTARQWASLRANLCTTLALIAAHRGRTDAPRRVPSPADALALSQSLGVRVVGHRDLSPDVDGDGTVEPHEWLKSCPGFDVSAWLAGGMEPPAGHLLEGGL
jgi:N-acetyl-anhydromuramyl-L-alanine amidase AmpD